MSEELFSGQPRRWTPKRKVRAVLLVHEGQIPRRVALKLWEISEEEWTAWELLYRRHGAKGLRATSVQTYRHVTLKKGLQMNKPVAALAAVLFFAHAAHAQMPCVVPGGCTPNDWSQSRGFSITTPGELPTRVTPNGAVGGYTVTTPGRPMSFISPNGLGGYTVMTPGRPPTFIRPND